MSSQKLSSEIYMPIAKEISRQIAPIIKMRCATRNFVAGTENGLVYLIFRVTVFSQQRKHHTVKIILNALDTYDIYLYHFNTRTGHMKIVQEYTGIYCDQLNALLDQMCA